MTLVEVAAELKQALGDADAQEVSYALELEALVAGKHRAKLELLAARIGLSISSTVAVLDQYERRARAMQAAQQLIAVVIKNGQGS